ncbi:sigma-70 family RNA polymerase sigma factor [Streptomyces silaceus]|uniref:sigma-70 family RNA polymerase sigma factor n=1 Tax=Streptomyces silaceus TaxID=545123 RepID=UPI0006EBD8BA|nr:sigma-70 family RNA polymerase sigma factor [Streptomyces silaceus]
MSTSQRGRTKAPESIALDQAEAVIVDRYTRLVRLAYLTLPGTLSRHRRVLVAHALVQRALPGFRARRALPKIPAPRAGEAGRAEAAWLTARVLGAALSHDRRPRGWPKRLPPPRELHPTLPTVWGLRLFPRAGGTEEIELAQLLTRLSAPARAAFVLCALDGLPRDEVVELLGAAGVTDPHDAMRTADELRADVGDAAGALLNSQEFDACSVQTRPTDLVRRRRRFRLAWCAVGVAAIGGTALTAVDQTVHHDDRTRPTGSYSALSVDALQRTKPDVWADTSRVDFTAWPARGALTGDRALLRRALSAWTDPPRGTRVTATKATSTQPPPDSTQLLYAGVVGGETVVLFHDGRRVIRYGEPASPSEPATLSFVRADDSDVTTAAALAVGRADGKVRYLTAPWIAEAQTRDLLRPNAPGRPLDVSDEGLTKPVEAPSAGGPCDSMPVLQLRSSDKIVEKHAFLVADLGDLAPVHLSYTPLPGTGAPSRQPREATSGTALQAWARGACRLPELRGRGVRSVNQWDFADQDLPENGGRAVWSCTRASTWRGDGDVLVQFRTSTESPTSPAKVAGRARSTASCSRFGQHVVAATGWTAGSGHRYLLAAGSRDVTGISVTGDVKADKSGRTLAVRAPKDAEVTVRARLAEGGSLSEVGASGTTRR